MGPPWGAFCQITLTSYYYLRGSVSPSVCPYPKWPNLLQSSMTQNNCPIPRTGYGFPAVRRLQIFLVYFCLHGIHAEVCFTPFSPPSLRSYAQLSLSTCTLVRPESVSQSRGNTWISHVQNLLVVTYNAQHNSPRWIYRYSGSELTVIRLSTVWYMCLDLSRFRQA